jgi:hypothetical protein
VVGRRVKGYGARYHRVVALTDADVRARVLAILDDSKTFESLCHGIRTSYATTEGHAVFASALRFIDETDPSGLDAELQERFAQALSRMVESTRALELAGALEG